MLPASIEVRAPERRAEWAIYLGVACATTLGHACLVALPFEVGAIVDGLKLNAAQSGMLATAQMAAYSLTNFVLAPFAGRWSTRRLGVAGSVLIIGSSVGAAETANLWAFGAWQAAAGMGFGLVFGCANVAGCLARIPERAYAIGLGVSIFFYTALPQALARTAAIARGFPSVFLPHSGVFVAVAVFATVMMPTMGFLPRRSTDELRTASLGAQTGARGASSPGIAASALLVMALFAFGVFSLYAFIERHARGIGMTAADVGSMFSAAFAVGLLGTITSASLGRRIGLAVPLVGGLAAQGIACWLVALSSDRGMLYACAMAYMVLWYFVYPYIFGLGAKIDSLGRVSTAIGGVYLIGLSLGASLGGLLFKQQGFLTVGWLALILCLAAAALAWVLLKRLDAQPHAEAS